MKIYLEGVPCAQKRMRSHSHTGFSHIYDPSKKDKNHIKEEIKKQADLELFDHPQISFVFFFPIPKSTSKKQAKLYSSGHYKYEKKPDVDNLIKLYLDCLDGILFEGDQKVTLGSCIKLYSDHPRTIIIIKEQSSLVSPQELDDSVREEVFFEPTL